MTHFDQLIPAPPGRFAMNGAACRTMLMSE